MSYSPFRRAAAVLWAIGVICTALLPFAAADRAAGQASNRFSIGNLDDSFSAGDPATVTAQFTAATADQPALLMITARMQPGWHTYSLTQPKGGPLPTKIKLTPSPKAHLLAPFRANPAAKSRIDKEAWIGLELQEHEGEVVWYAPVELAAGVDPQTLEIRGLVDMQVCKEQCVPVKPKFVAKLASAQGRAKSEQLLAIEPGFKEFATPPVFDARVARAGSYQADGSVVKITGRLEPATVKPGQRARLSLAATVDRGWHMYAYAARDDQPGSKPTLIAFDSAWGLTAFRPTTDAPITTETVKDFPTLHYYQGPVTWTIDIDVPADAEPGAYPLSGVIAYQACEFKPDGSGSCEIPKGARFRVTLNVGDAQGAPAGNGQPKFAPITYKDAATVSAAWADVLDSLPAKPDRAAVVTPPSPDRTAVVEPPSPDRTAMNPMNTSPVADPTATVTSNVDVPMVQATNIYDLNRVRVQEPADGSLAGFIALAFVGGLILNLMPCVLPVIGLKVMSFVEQAGKSRQHALALNGWYALGIISVFVLLGILAATIGLSWGAQFGNTTFNVIMAAVVFAMALSLLGVWEVPIPGFFGSGAVQHAAAQEGPTGAFLKGVVTTVLATPCGAPYMAPAIAWAVGQRTDVTLAVFASVGLGMASPYLVVGVFPELLRFLPKPGQWMETFKQVTGFVLLATVVFILSFIEPAAVVPTVLLLVGVAMACWLIARTPLTADPDERRKSWVQASVALLAFGIASFGWLYPDVMWPRYGGLRTAVKEGWDPFSLARLQRVAVDEGRTVLVDFSANWCFNCKVLEAAELHTMPVEQAVASTGAVKMYADFTDYPPEIDDTLKHLKSNGVPVIAIFPGDRPYDPIVFRGGYRETDIVAALNVSKSRRGVVTTEGAVTEVMATRQ